MLTRQPRMREPDELRRILVSYIVVYKPHSRLYFPDSVWISLTKRT